MCRTSVGIEETIESGIAYIPGIESVFQPRCEWTAKSWPYERHQKYW